MLINVRDIPITGEKYDVDIDIESLELDIPVLEVPHFQGMVFRSGEDVRIQGHLMASIEVECHRCLEAFPLKISSELELFYQPYPSIMELEEEEIAVGELGILHYKDNTIDLAWAIRDTIILEIPMKVLCKEDCQGLCPQCGENLNYRSCQCKEKSLAYNPFREFFSKTQIVE